MQLLRGMCLTLVYDIKIVSGQYCTTTTFATALVSGTLPYGNRKILVGTGIGPLCSVRARPGCLGDLTARFNAD